MSKYVSTFLATIASLLVASCIMFVGPVGGSMASSDEDPAPPTTTTTVPATDGNPWHG